MDLQLTDAQRDQVASLYEAQVGALPMYDKLIAPIKRIACAMAFGNVMHLTIESFEDALEDEDFQIAVDAIIEAYEATHPDKINHAEQLSKALADLAKGLDWQGQPAPDGVIFSVAPDGETSRLHHDPELGAQFDSIIADFDN